MPAPIMVRHEDGDRYTVTVRDHTLIVDQPERDGGDDAGPTPTEVFVAGLASCVAFYAGRFLARHDVALDGFAVRCEWAMAEDRPARVASIRLSIEAPSALPAELRNRLVAVASHCTVHNSILRPPDIDVAVVDAAIA